MTKPKDIPAAGDAHRRAQAAEAARDEAPPQPAEQKQSGVRALRHEDIHATR